MSNKIITIKGQLYWSNILNQYVTLPVSQYSYGGPLALAGGVSVVEQTDWAFYNDGTESASTQIGSVNQNPTLEVDTIYHVRFGVEETANVSEKDIEGVLQYNLNSAGWVDANATSSVVQITNSANLTDGADTTQRISVFTFDATNEGVDDVNGRAGGTSADFRLNGAEFLYSFQILSGDVVDTDSIQLRVLDKNSLPFDIYNQADPAITVNEGIAPINISSAQTEEGDAQTSSMQVIVDIITANQTEVGDTQAASLKVIPVITANQNEVGDLQTGSIIQAPGPIAITASQTEAGDLQTSALNVIPVIAASQTEVGDTQLSSLQVIQNIEANQNEAGDTQLSIIEVVINIASNQLEVGDVQLSDIKVAVSLNSNQNETGDTQTAGLAGAVITANVAANQNETGDLQTALIDVSSLIECNQLETGDTQLANLQIPVQVSAAQLETGDLQTGFVSVVVSIDSDVLEDGDVTAAALSSALVANIVSSQTEAGDTNTSFIDVLLQLSADQVEAIETQTALISVVVNLTANTIEAGDSTSAVIAPPSIVRDTLTVNANVSRVFTVTATTTRLLE